MRYKRIVSGLVYATCASIVPALAQGNATESVTAASAQGADAVHPPEAAGGAETATPPPAVSTASGSPHPPATGEVPKVLAGPLAPERAALLKKILQAKQEGCGVSSYLSEFGRIQDAATSGQPSGPLKDRIGSLSKALDEQLERSRVLKVQRIPPAPQSFVSHGAPSANNRGGLDVNQLMRQYGNKIPKDMNKQALMKEIGNDSGNKNLNADDLIKRFKDDPRAKDILNQLKAQ